MSQPNIVFINTDQQSADAMSCAGNAYLHTPAVDRLARTGVRFPNAYTAHPLCVPARMSFFTGRMPHEMGVFVNTQETDEPCAVPFFGPRLREAGYRRHYVGKWHLTVPETNVEEHGFEKVVFGGGYGGLDKDKASEAVRFLENPPDTPFFLVVSFNNPHDCCELSRGQGLRMESLPGEPGLDELPPVPDNIGSAEDGPEVLRKFQREYPNIGCALQWNEDQIRRYRWGYNRLVEMVDRQIGRVLEALERTGRWENTLIVFTSDHGDGQGAHHWNQKWCAYDEVSRVPFIVKAPGQNADGGLVDDRLVSAGLDLAPTICDYAGVPPPEKAHGRSVRPVVENPDAGWARSFVACEASLGTWAALHEDRWPKIRMIRSERFKYVLYQAAESHCEQLFDMWNDPGEIRDLAADARYTEVVEQHRERLRTWCRQTDDDVIPQQTTGPAGTR